jgi:hypothetical protein
MLYLVPAIPLALAHLRPKESERRSRFGTAGGLLVGLLLGVSPLLVCDWAATGSALRTTQWMEVQSFFSSRAKTPGADGAGVRIGPAGPAWQGGTGEAVEGGGLRVANLPRTLPVYLVFLREAYGEALLGLGAWGALIALVRRRMLFVVAVPYIAAALLFFGCWVKADPRYLCGVFVLLPLLIVEGSFGTLDLVRRLDHRGMRTAARLAALFAGVVVILAAKPTQLIGVRDPSHAAGILLPLVVGAGALVVTVWPSARISDRIAPLVALTLTGVAVGRVVSELPARARFQLPEVLRARATLSRVVAAGSVVITTEEIGRPAENIDYYSDVAHALYLSDLIRWKLPLPDALTLLLRGGMAPYLLLPSDDSARVDALRPEFEVDLVAHVAAPEAIAYFVASPFHRGVPLALYRVRARAAAPGSGG